MSFRLFLNFLLYCLAALQLVCPPLVNALPKFGQSLPITDAFFPSYLTDALKDVRSGDCEEAIQKLHRELSLRNSEKPEHRSREAAAHKILLLQGVAQLDCDRADDAEKSLVSAAELSPSNSYIQFLKGVAEWRLNKKPDALKAFDEAVWFSRKDWVSVDELQYRIALIHVESGEKDQAKARLEAALAENSKNIPVLIALADLVKDDDRPAAIKYLRSARSADDSHPVPKLELAKLLLNDSASDIGDKELKEALNMSEEVKNSPTPPENSPWSEASIKKAAVITEIKALLLMKDLDKAAQQLDEANAAYKNDADLAGLQRQLDIERNAKAGESAPSDAQVSESSSEEASPLPK